MSIKKYLPADDLFPQALVHIAQPPKQIFVLSNNWEQLLHLRKVAIVGSRKASSYGQSITGRLASDLASRGIVIVSGLALGIDSVAHQAAIDAGGFTIAVLPTGLDNIVPISHHGLAKQIVKTGGALISEYPPGELPYMPNFVARNRLIAGLAEITLVTEAAEKSGSLHTANFALDQGKTVMAVPGNINNPGARGTNRLLKTGAGFVTEAQDILDELGIKTAQSRFEHIGMTSHEKIIIELISSGVTDAAVLQVQSGLEPNQFNQTLTMLEINGRVAKNATDWSLK